VEDTAWRREGARIEVGDMKNYLMLRKEELKKRGVKGFTLMEMLIVVAIIAVLIAIAIPVFTSQLEKSREATDGANIRSKYGEAMVAILENPKTDITGNAYVVELQQTVADWQNEQVEAGLQSLDNTDDVTFTDLDKVGQGKKAKITYVASTGKIEIAIV